MIVREHVGMFDCSHMGEARLDGPDALKNVNNLFSNSFDSMKDAAAVILSCFTRTAAASTT